MKGIKTTVENIELTRLLLELILNQNKIVIPAFQRKFVWKTQQKRDLLESLFRGYPIGSLIVWEHDRDAIDHEKLSKKESNTNPVWFLLDGQQRVKSLYFSLVVENKDVFYWDMSIDIDDRQNSLILSENEVRSKIKDLSKNTEKIWALKYINIEKEVFKDATIIEFAKKNARTRHISDDSEFTNLCPFSFINIKLLISDDHPSIWSWLLNKGMVKINKHTQYSTMATTYQTYQIPIINSRGELKDVVEIFDRINQKGTRLNVFDILVATTYERKTENTKGYNLREVMETLLSTEGISNFFNYIDSNSEYEKAALIIIRSIALACDKINSINKSDLLDLNPTVFRGFNFTKDLLETNQKLPVREAIKLSIEFIY